MINTLDKYARGMVFAHGKGGSGDPLIKQGRKIIVLKGYGSNKPDVGSVLDYNITKVKENGVAYAQVWNNNLKKEKIVFRDVGMKFRNKDIEKKMFIPKVNQTLNSIEDMLSDEIFNNGNSHVKKRIINGVNMIKNNYSNKKYRDALASANNLYSSLLNEGNYNPELNKKLASIGMYKKLGNLEKQLS